MIFPNLLVLPLFVSASLLPLANAQSRVFCIKMERSATGQFTECLQGVNDQSNVYVKHADLATTTQKLTSGTPPATLPNIAQGEVFTYVWSANNQGDVKAQQCELYRDPLSFASTTTASTPEESYAQWIIATNQIAAQRPFSNNEDKYAQTNMQYNRQKCVDFIPTDGSIWASIYNTQNGTTAMIQNKFCYGQATMPKDMPSGPQRLIYHFWHEDSVNMDWVSVQYVNVVKAGTNTQKSGYVEKDDGMNYITGSYNGQTAATSSSKNDGDYALPRSSDAVGVRLHRLVPTPPTTPTKTETPTESPIPPVQQQNESQVAASTQTVPAEPVETKSTSTQPEQQQQQAESPAATAATAASQSDSASDAESSSTAAAVLATENEKAQSAEQQTKADESAH